MAVGSETDKEFYLETVELRYQSEHTLNGQHMDAELQFVHKSQDGKQAMVVAVLIEKDPSMAADNNFLSQLLHGLDEGPFNLDYVLTYVSSVVPWINDIWVTHSCVIVCMIMCHWVIARLF